MKAVETIVGELARDRDGANNGDPQAQLRLGKRYLNGNAVPKDSKEAVKWFRKAAEHGLAEAQLALADCLYDGIGTETNHATAVEWFRKAAEQGSVRAQYNLGGCYYSGRGVEQNYAKAVEWCRKAAEQGYARAQYNLGGCYYSGRGVEQNYAKAVEWYRKAAEQGDADAQNSLGSCYDSGKGVKQDYSKAVEWYRKAAEQGHATAQNNLKNHEHDRIQLWSGGPYWATTNIGAENPWDYGLYFWWGDTLGYRREGDAWVASDGSRNLDWEKEGNTPTWGKDNATLRREGWTTLSGVLVPARDAAQAHWGGNWRMPTRSEISDLDNNCNWTWTTRNGVKGYVVRGRGAYAGASIFLPAAGCFLETLGGVGSFGCYWSSVPYSDDSISWHLCFDSDHHGTPCDDGLRCLGEPVRPVLGLTE